MDHDIIRSLDDCHVVLRNLYIAIQRENGEGQQFDHTSHPSLARVVDRLRATISHIERTVYKDKLNCCAIGKTGREDD